MPVIGYNIAGISNNSTVDKLVVVGVCLNQIESIHGIKTLNVWAFQNCHDNDFCNLLPEKPVKYFSVFFNNLVANAQCVFTVHDRIPHRTGNAMKAYTLNKAIGVEDYSHNLMSLFHSLLFAQPCVKVHFVNLIKAFLVKLARLPHLIKYLIHLTGIVIADEFLDIKQFFIRLNVRKYFQQIKLGRIENCSFHKRYVMISPAKINKTIETSK